MKLSAAGIELLSRLEGRTRTMYRDSAGLPTIGVGHLIGAGEAHLLTATLTDEQIDALLRADVAEAEEAVARQFPTVKRQNQFDALVSFLFNLGEPAVDRGSLDELIAANAPAESIASKWREYVYAGGVRMEGLRFRRQAEVQHYFRHLWLGSLLLCLIAAACLIAGGTTLLTA